VQKKRPRCVAERKDGSQCTNLVLTPEGLQSLLDKGASLVPDAGRFCSFHSRSPEDRHRMQRLGGAYSPKKLAKLEQARAEAPDPMPRQFALASYRLIERLLDAKLPTFPPEPDQRRQALGAFLAGQLYAIEDGDRARFMYSLVNRQIAGRGDIVETAESELRAVIAGLDPEEQKIAWEIAGAA
jgi:hypothetical protein